MRRKQERKRRFVRKSITKLYPIPPDFDKLGDTLDCDKIFKFQSSSTEKPKQIAKRSKQIRKKRSYNTHQAKVDKIVQKNQKIMADNAFTSSSQIEQNLQKPTQTPSKSHNIIQEDKSSGVQNSSNFDICIDINSDHKQQSQQQIPQIVNHNNKRESSEQKEISKQSNVPQTLEPIILLDDEEMEHEQKNICDICKKQSEFQILKINNFYNCSKCLLIIMNPLSEIIEVLCNGKIYQSYPYHINKMEHIEIDFRIKNELRVNNELAIEIRCIQLTQQGMQESTFPQSCVLLFNGKQVKVIKPLQIKSSLHKRKDDIITVKNLQFLKEENFINQLTVKQTTPEQHSRIDQPGTLYMFALLLVKQKSVDQVIEDIKKDQLNLTELHFVNKIKSQYEDDDIQIEKVQIQLTCQITFDLLDTPARGKYCTHMQCFSLRNYLMMMKSSEHKKWRCLVCKQVCYQFEIDKLQQFIIEKIRKNQLNIREISFTKNEQGYPTLANEELQRICEQKHIVEKILQKKEITID